MIGRKSSHTCHLVARSVQSVSSIQPLSRLEEKPRPLEPEIQRSNLPDRSVQEPMSVRFRRANPKKPVRRVHSESQLKSNPLPPSPSLVVRVVYNTTKPRGGHPSNVAVHDTWYRVLVAQPSPFSSLVHLCHLPIPCSEPLSSLPPAFSPRPRPGPRCVWVSIHEPGRQRLASAKLTCKHRYVLVSV